MSDYLPVYYQACKDATPLQSAIDMLGLSLSMGPIVIIASVSVTALRMYRVQHWLGWAVFMVGMGVFTTLDADAPISHAIGLPLLLGIGSGILYGECTLSVICSQASHSFRAPHKLSPISRCFLPSPCPRTRTRSPSSPSVAHSLGYVKFLQNLAVYEAVINLHSCSNSLDLGYFRWRICLAKRTLPAASSFLPCRARHRCRPLVCLHHTDTDVGTAAEGRGTPRVWGQPHRRMAGHARHTRHRFPRVVAYAGRAYAQRARRQVGTRTRSAERCRGGRREVA